MENFIEEIKRIGKMPNQDLENDNSEVQVLVEKYRQLIAQIPEPLTIELAKELINILPIERFYDLQWDILAKIETIELQDISSITKYKELINSCPNEEIKSNLIAGLENELENE